MADRIGPRIMCNGCGEVEVGLFHPICDECYALLMAARGFADPAMEIGATTHGPLNSEDNANG